MAGRRAAGERVTRARGSSGNLVSAEETRAHGANDSAPFELSGDGVGCFLIHGFTATPWEMRFLGERLHSAGRSVRAVQLMGHGTSPEDLERGLGGRVQTLLLENSYHVVSVDVDKERVATAVTAFVAQTFSDRQEAAAS